MKIVPLLLCGGVGSRLWPLSRKDFPKPFIQLPNGKTLFSEAIERIKKLSISDELVVACGEHCEYLVKHELQKNNISNVRCIIEPMPKNTAPAIILSSLYISKLYGEDCKVLAISADHLINDTSNFKSAIDQAINLSSNNIVIFGIKPTYPETGYGYIQSNGNSVLNFVEKPDLATAKDLLKDSEVLWNAGIFLFDIKTIIQESRDYCPEILNQLQEISIENVRELRVSKDNYANMPSIAIDKAILEKTPNLSVVACDIDWDDIGTWKSFSKLCNLDENNNKTFGKVYSINTQNCTILNSENEHPIAAVGLSDLVIVQSSGSVLITNNEHCQDVKSLSQFPDLINNDYEKSYRPWGSYIVLDKGPNYKLKRIEVRSAGALSLQSHDHRDEHWTCVQGEVLVTLGDNVFTLKANESIYIPKKTKHRMQNLTQETAIIIEIQTGSHLAEDDIIRYQDIYNRHTLK